jgi:hypothetical protein
MVGGWRKDCGDRQRERRRASSVLEGEADFEGDLPVLDLAFVDGAAGLGDLKPRELADGFVGALERVVYGVLDGRGRGAGEFEEFVDVVFHGGTMAIGKRSSGPKLRPWVRENLQSAPRARYGALTQGAGDAVPIGSKRSSGPAGFIVARNRGRRARRVSFGRISVEFRTSLTLITSPKNLNACQTREGGILSRVQT